MNYDYDLFVIGAGSGGVRASRVAAQLGAKVAVAEDRYLGGTCVNVGCVPKKLFVFASEFSAAAEDAKGFGWKVNKPDFHWPTLRDNSAKEITRLNGIYGSVLDNAGVELINGRAEVRGPHEVAVGETMYTAKNILVAVGGWPRKPTFPGSEYTVDSNQVFSMKELPRRVLVQGGGYIAVEFAGIFNGLGCETEVVYRGPLFLRGFDEEIRCFVKQEIIRSGVTLTFNSDIESIEKLPSGAFSVTLTNGEVREVDLIFSAVGREPKTQGLGLENTKVTFNSDGSIGVNDNFQTAEPSIYALGDVIGRVALTPVALAEGTALARFLFDNAPINMSYENIATAIFCQPNIGTLGLGEEEAKASGKALSIYTSEFKPLKNTVSGSEQRTLMKLIVDDVSDRVIGVHMSGPDAGEIIQGFAIALMSGATKKDFDRTIGIHPTAAEEFVTMRESVRRFP